MDASVPDRHATVAPAATPTTAWGTLCASPQASFIPRPHLTRLDTFHQQRTDAVCVTATVPSLQVAHFDGQRRVVALHGQGSALGIPEMFLPFGLEGSGSGFAALVARRPVLFDRNGDVAMCPTVPGTMVNALLLSHATRLGVLSVLVTTQDGVLHEILATTAGRSVTGTPALHPVWEPDRTSPLYHCSMNDVAAHPLWLDGPRLAFAVFDAPQAVLALLPPIRSGGDRRPMWVEPVTVQPPGEEQFFTYCAMTPSLQFAAATADHDRYVALWRIDLRWTDGVPALAGLHLTTRVDTSTVGAPRRIRCVGDTFAALCARHVVFVRTTGEVALRALPSEATGSDDDAALPGDEPTPGAHGLDVTQDGRNVVVAGSAGTCVAGAPFPPPPLRDLAARHLGAAALGDEDALVTAAVAHCDVGHAVSRSTVQAAVTGLSPVVRPVAEGQVTCLACTRPLAPSEWVSLCTVCSAVTCARCCGSKA